MAGDAASRRAAELATRLQDAADALIAVVRDIDRVRWSAVPAPDAWSIGKDAAHVAEAAVMHQWIVRLTVGERVSSRQPPIERREVTTSMSPEETIQLIRLRTQQGVNLVRGLSAAQLDLPTNPPRARGQVLGETIERVLIGHYDVHRIEIQAKSGGAQP